MLKTKSTAIRRLHFTYFILCVLVICPNVFMYQYMPSAFREEVARSSELELLMVVGCYVGAGN